MNKLIAISAALGLALSTHALPTYDDFSTYGPTGTQLGGNTAPSGESWVTYTNSTTAALDGLSVGISNYFTLHADTLKASLPPNFPGPFVSGFDTSAYSVAVPTNNPLGSTFYGLGACLAFTSDVAGAVGQTVYASFFFDVSLVDPANTDTLFNGNSSTYNSWFAGFMASSNVPSASGANQLTGPENFERLVLRATANTKNTQTFWATLGDAFDGAPPFSGTGANYLATPMTGSTEMTSATIHFIVIAYEWGTNGVLGNDAERLWLDPSSGYFGASAEPTPTEAKSTGLVNSVPLTDAGGFFLVTGPGTDGDGGAGEPSGPILFNSLRVATNWAYVTGGAQFTSYAPASVTNSIGQTFVLNTTAQAGGVPATYSWQTNNGVNSGPLITGGRFNVGATGALTISDFQAGDAGTYTLQVSTPITSENGVTPISAQTIVNVDPTLVSYTTNVTVLAGGTGDLSVTATTQTSGLTYQWQENAVNLTNGNNGTGTVYSNVQSATLALSHISASDAGVPYDCIVSNAVGSAITVGPMFLTVNSLLVSQPSPASVNANYGATVSFSATASPAGSYSYSWLWDGNTLNNGSSPPSGSGATISGATTTNLTLAGVAYQDAGSYTLSINNGQAVSVAPAILTVNDPYLITQPVSQQVNTGGNATFTVSANGSPTLTYQWLSNGAPLSDAGIVAGSSTAALTLTGVTDPYDASYSVVVNGGSGVPTNSAVATLFVNDPVTVAPMMQSWIVAANSGVRVVFAPVIGGSPPLTITWTSNGFTLPATNAALSITNPSATGVFNYHVQISNPYGVTNSASATLTVLPRIAKSTNNLVVARVGDGAQTLNTSSGNTLYMDQFTLGGAYVGTLMIPDSGAGALAVAGGPPDGLVESVLTLSSNGLYLNFCGFNVTLPGAYSEIGNASDARIIGALSGTGLYTPCLTNNGLYSSGTEVRSASSSNGLFNFWTTGGNAGIKYVNPTIGGGGIPEVASEGPSDARVVQVLGPNLGANFFYTDGQAGAVGLWEATGNVETAATVTQVISAAQGSVSPDDFAVSPDFQTIYIADESLQPAGGIQRWDTNSSGGYLLSYTLADSTGSGTNGMRGLAVNWGAASAWGATVGGETLYATTSEASSNRIVEFMDNGATPSADTLVSTAWPNELFRGIRFAPVVVYPAFSTNPPPVFVASSQFQLNLTGLPNANFRLWNSTNLALAPVTSTWNLVTSGTFNSAGTATYTDTQANNIAEYYVITQP